MITTTRKPKPEITSAAIYRCTVKATGEIFYLVASDSVPGLFYQITWNAQACAWQCHCPATKPCKHERALRQVQTAQFHARKAEEQFSATAVDAETLSILAQEAEQERKALEADVRALHVLMNDPCGMDLTIW